LVNDGQHDIEPVSAAAAAALLLTLGFITPSHDVGISSAVSIDSSLSDLAIVYTDIINITAAAKR